MMKYINVYLSITKTEKKRYAETLKIKHTMSQIVHTVFCYGSYNNRFWTFNSWNTFYYIQCTKFWFFTTTVVIKKLEKVLFLMYNSYEITIELWYTWDDKNMYFTYKNVKTKFRMKIMSKVSVEVIQYCI